MSNIFYLKNSDFSEGTYRIRIPGIYILLENIVFHPNPLDDFLPRKDQSELYPMDKGYILGFFAAITMETENISLDLNGYSIEFSKEFNLKQRFGALIELSSSPFIPKQGPANFGNTFQKCKNVEIKNGYLKRVSHHGIHGNNPENVRLHNLKIEDFEVAGISINGGLRMEISNVDIRNNSNVDAMSFYSQSKFCISALKQIVDTTPTATLETHYGTITGDQIVKDMEKEIIDFEESVLNGKAYDGLFKNETGLYDGNVYGLVLNSNGVVINEFKGPRDANTIGNEGHFLKNIRIKNLKSNGRESQVLGFNHGPGPSSSYGANVCKGFAGDVLDFEFATNNKRYYKGNVLSNAQLFINKYGSGRTLGSCNIPAMTYEWIKNEQSIEDFIKENENMVYWVKGTDSMAHVMKGNLGLFISQGKDIYMEDIVIDGVENVGSNPNHNSSQSIGLIIVGSTGITKKQIIIDDIVSTYGNSKEQYIL